MKFFYEYYESDCLQGFFSSTYCSLIQACAEQVSLMFINLFHTSGFTTTHVVVYLWVCKTSSYHLLISPPPTNLPHSLPAPYHSPSIPVKDSYWRETLIKLTARVECGASIHAIFQLTGRRIRMFF